jgi:hypothetical protein
MPTSKRAMRPIFPVPLDVTYQQRLHLPICHLYQVLIAEEHLAVDLEPRALRARHFFNHLQRIILLMAQKMALR